MEVDVGGYRAYCIYLLSPLQVSDAFSFGTEAAQMALMAEFKVTVHNLYNQTMRRF